MPFFDRFGGLRHNLSSSAMPVVSLVPQKAGSMACRKAWLGILGLALLAGPGPAAAPPQSPTTAPSQETPGQAYYHFAMGRLYERLFEQNYDSGGRSEYANLAIENYKKAYELDPFSETIGERLAEMYAKSQRIREAVLEAEDLIKRDPTHVAARRLLARIYIRTLSGSNAGTTQSETLRRAIVQLREVVRLAPADAESALWLARLYRFQNEHERAGEVLRGVLEREPSHEAALEQLAQLLLDQGRATEAIALLEKRGGDESGAGLLVLLGDAYAQVENHAGAAQAFRRALERDPRRTDARSKLARALAQQGKAEEAIAQYRRLAEADGADPESYLRLAQLYRQLGNLQAAEESIVRARERAPGSLEVIFNESLIYEAQGRFEDAIRTLSSAVANLKVRRSFGPPEQQRRSLSILYEQLGRLYREMENFPAAVSTYGELMNLGPDEQRAGRALLVECYRESKQLDLALAESTRLLEAAPADRGAQISHALLLADRAETDAAAQRLRGLLAGTREDREIHLTLAQVLERGRRYPAAEQALDAAEKLSQRPAEREITHFLRGAIFERQKKYDLAEEQFKRVLEINARNAGALNYYGYMLADRGLRLEEAVALIRRALAEEAFNGSYLDSLGWAYYKQGKLGEAEENLRRAAGRSRSSPTIHDHLGDVYAKLGRSEQAAAAWERSLAEWKRATPAEFEADRASATEAKLKQLKNKLAQRKGTGETKP
jgi:tetratricopeptide (TPR) repeat protein